MPALLAVLLAAIPIAASGFPSAESSLPIKSHVSAFSAQTKPSIATDGTSFFAVWTDYRRNHNPAIYGSRISANGEILDRTGILVSEPLGEPFFQTDPTIAWVGTHYVVFWRDSLSKIKARRISADGKFLDDAPRIFARSTSHPRVVSAGSSMLVDGVSRDGLALFDADLNLISVIRLTDGPEFAAFATDGMSFLILEGGVNRRATRVSQSGAILEVNEVKDAQSPPVITFFANLVWTGSDYLMIWPRRGPVIDSRFTSFLYAARFSPRGELKSEILTLREPDPSETGFALASAGDGSAVATYVFRGQTYARRIAATLGEPALLGGAFDDNSFDRLSAISALPGLDRYVALWTVQGTFARDLQLASLDENGMPLETKVPIQIAAPEQSGISTSRRPSDWIAWRESDDEEARQIEVLRLGTADPIRITDGPARKSAPAIAEGSHTVAVAWYEGTVPETGNAQLRLAFLSDSVAISKIVALDDHAGLTRAGSSESDGEPPAIVWTGQVYLVAWKSSVSQRLKVAAIAEDGRMISVVEERGPQSEPFHPVFGFNGSESLLVWQDGFTPYTCVIPCDPPDEGQIVARRFTARGDPIETPFVVWRAGLRPSAAWNGNQYLIAWSADNVVQAARVSATGFVIESFPLELGRGDNVSLGVERDAFVLAFERPTDNPSPTKGRYETVVARVSSFGAVIDIDTATTQATMGLHSYFEQTPPAIATTSFGTAVLYRRIGSEPQFAGVPRLFYRFTSETAFDAFPRRRAVRP